MGAEKLSTFKKEDLEILKKLDFGRWEAQHDKDLKYVYVETDDFESLLLKIHTIIIGRKGSGKSALVQGIKLKHLQKYEDIVEIDAGQVEFRKLAESYKTLPRIEEFEFRRAIRNIWYHAMVTSLMLKVNDKRPDADPALQPKFELIYKYLKKQGWLKKTIYDLLIDVADSLTQILHKKMGEGEEPSTFVRILANYPLQHADFKSAFWALTSIVKHSKGYVITFDNIDRYFDTKGKRYWYRQEDLKMLRYLFEGLIYAIYDLSAEEIADKLLIKALLPTDKYEPLRLREADKIDQFVKRIFWNKEGLREFICKRIALSLGIKDASGNYSADPQKTWYKVFPRRIRNIHVNRIEDSFDYILRHTLYRPRDLQIHCSKIVETALSEKRTIDEELIRKCLHRVTNETIVDYLHREFESEYPYIDHLLSGFKNKDNMMSYSTTFKIVNRTLKKINYEFPDIPPINVENTIAFLYKIGFLGCMEEVTQEEVRKLPTKKFYGKNVTFFFYFNKPYHNLKYSKHVVIHPVFYERYEVIPSNKYVIG